MQGASAISIMDLSNRFRICGKDHQIFRAIREIRALALKEPADCLVDCDGIQCSCSSSKIAG
jgi:hypothetical protein